VCVCIEVAYLACNVVDHWCCQTNTTTLITQALVTVTTANTGEVLRAVWHTHMWLGHRLSFNTWLTCTQWLLGKGFSSPMWNGTADHFLMARYSLSLMCFHITLSLLRACPYSLVPCLYWIWRPTFWWQFTHSTGPAHHSNTLLSPIMKVICILLQHRSTNTRKYPIQQSQLLSGQWAL